MTMTERNYNLTDLTLQEVQIASAYLEGYRMGKQVGEEKTAEEVEELEDRIDRLEAIAGDTQ